MSNPSGIDGARWTKGPWSYVRRGHDRYIVDGEGDAICQPFTEAWDDQQEHCKPFPVEANARLIAAAPDMAEALAGLLKALSDDAHGRSESDHALENAYADARAALSKALSIENDGEGDNG